MTTPVVITAINVMVILELKHSKEDVATKLKRYNEHHGDIIMRAIKEHPSDANVPLVDIAKRANEIRQEFLAELNGTEIVMNNPGESNENTWRLGRLVLAPITP